MSNLEFGSTEDLETYIHSLLAEYPDVKIDSSKVLDYHYSYRMNDKYVYWGDEKARSADYDSFVICLTRTFAKDKNKCYAGATSLKNATPTSFHSLNWTHVNTRRN